MSATVFWFTGLSGAGKTTIAFLTKSMLERDGFSVGILDGDDCRNSYHRPLGFSKEDILINNSLIAQKCKENLGNYDFIFVPVISPFEEGRTLAKQIIGPRQFSLIYFSANLETVNSRDVKGLYLKAKNGDIGPMIGTSDLRPYEIPHDFDLEINSSIGVESVNESTDKLFRFVMDVTGKNLNSSKAVQI